MRHPHGWVVVFSGFLGLLSASLAHAGAPDVSGTAAEQVLMVSIGDSITVGTFADTSLETPAQGPQALALVDNRYTLSWATGTDILSHRALLAAALERSGDRRPLVFENEAVVNSLAENLVPQLEKVRARMEADRNDELAYVTLLTGSNDACRPDMKGGTPIPEFKSRLHAALGAIFEMAQPGRKVRVLMSTLPRIADLGAPEIRGHKTWLSFSCDSVRTVLNECRSLTTWKNEEEYRAASETVEGFNRAIGEVAQEAQRAYPSLEVAVSRSFSDHKIRTDELAADCFHPSRAGQESLARSLWKDQPWF